MTITEAPTSPSAPDTLGVTMVDASAAPGHELIEADALHALEDLATDYAGQVDALYVDPPYDHGDGGRRASQRHFAYDDRRSDWAGYIRARLAAAQPLLAPHACVIASIGWQRVHELAGILAETFPDRSLVTITVDLLRTPADRFGVQRRAEYLLVAVPEGVRLASPGEGGGEARNGWAALTLSGYTAADYPNQVYPVYVDERTGRIIGAGRSIRDLHAPTSAIGPAGAYRDVDPVPEGAVSIWPVTRSGRPVIWRISRETFVGKLAGGAVRADRPHMPGNPQPFVVKQLPAGTLKRIEAGAIATNGLDDRGALIVEGGIRPAGSVPTIWTDSRYETRAGTARLAELIGEGHGFAYPKPVDLVADILAACTPGRSDATVLDFFAGSGTTADAVFALNAADGGSRRVILVQHAEGRVFDDVLLPRVLSAAADHGASGTLTISRSGGAPTTRHLATAEA